MSALQTLSDSDLLARLPAVVRTERMATANVIEHLAEVDRRRLYLQAACPSLNQYCIERLGYSKEAAYKRARVARLVQRVPAALTELESGAIHLTGLSVIADHLTPENQNELLPACRGRTRGQIERLIASCFSEDLLLDRIEAAPGASGVLGTPAANTAAAPSAGPSPTGGMAHPPPRPLPARITPVSSTHDRIEFVASAALRDKIERAQRLLSHAVPSGDLAVLLERALDELIASSTRGLSPTAARRRSKTFACCAAPTTRNPHAATSAARGSNTRLRSDGAAVRAKRCRSLGRRPRARHRRRRESRPRPRPTERRSRRLRPTSPPRSIAAWSTWAFAIGPRLMPFSAPSPTAANRCPRRCCVQR